MASSATLSILGRSFWFWAGLIVLIRIALLFFADGGLGPDETQYWFWAQEPAFGYFSKPPMIAWIIASTAGIFGDSEWGVRLAAPVLHGATATFIYLLASSLFDRRIAGFAGLGWLTLPGASVSSALITTDAPLLVCWSGALYCFFRIVKAQGPAPLYLFLLLGAVIGFGLLSKYAMLYFLAASAVAIALSPSVRTALLRPPLILTGLVAIIMFAPNIAWNAANDFQTVSHTAANANWSADLFKPLPFLAFLGAQLAVFGPILFAGFILSLRTNIVRPNFDSDRFLLIIFAITPLLIVSIQAFISRAHANWAAAAYPAAIILVTVYLFENRREVWAKASLILHSVLAIFFLVLITNFRLADAVGAGAAVSELRGWKEMTEEIAAQAEGYDAILFDDRSMIGEMLYYQRDKGLEIAALDPNNGVHHHYEAFLAFQPDRHKRNLFVSIRHDDAHVNYRFSEIRKIGPVSAHLGASGHRTFTLFEISGYYGPPGVQYTETPPSGE